jgi:hypothetical protein
VIALALVRAQRRHQRLEAESPVRSLDVVVLDKLTEDRPEMLLVQDDQMVQALSA